MPPTIKTRKHHNNIGLYHRRKGWTKRSLNHIANKLGIPYDKPVDQSMEEFEKEKNEN